MSKIVHCEYEESDFLITMDYVSDGERSTIQVTRSLVTDGRVDPHYEQELIGHRQIDELPKYIVADYYELHYNGQLPV